MSTTALAYCRISKDREGRELGVERQTEDTLRLSQIVGLNVAPENVIVENDRSASVYAKEPRPLWDDVLRRVEAGEVTHVVAYSFSRLTRDLDELNALLRLRKLGLSVTTCLGQRIYPGMSAEEVRMVRYAGVNDAAESDLISERTARAFRQAAISKGTPHGPEAYGWTRSRERGVPVDTINEEQAAVIREVAGRIVAGEAFGAIVRDLNARGITATRGGTWTHGSLRKLMLRERNAGRRVHHGAVVTTELDGGRAAWQPILDDDTHDAVVAILRDPLRVPNRGPQRHLLSGLLTCGKCASFRMYVAVSGKAVPGYHCHDCRGIRRAQEPLDMYVVDTLVTRLAEPDALDWLAADATALDDARDRLAALRRKAATAAAKWAADEIDDDQLAVTNATLLPKIAAAAAEVEAARPLPGTVRALIGHGSVEATREAWDRLTLNARRDVIRTLLTITVLPTIRRRLDPDSIVFEWKSQTPA